MIKLENRVQASGKLIVIVLRKYNLFSSIYGPLYGWHSRGNGKPDKVEPTFKLVRQYDD